MTPVFAHITVPVDGSLTSERGTAFAIELARDGGRISFCSVVDPVLVCAPALQGAALDPGPMLEILDEDAAIFCIRAQDEAARGGIACDTQVLHGATTREIELFATHNQSDAIVIGTHGRTGIARGVLGSVTEGVVRRAAVPVVSVHEHDAMRTGPLAVAVDQSPAAGAALDVAIAIAAARGMASMIVYVCAAASAAAHVSALFEEAATRARGRGIAAQVVVREGNVADELLAAAEENDCCMLVMGTHGRSPLARLALGSVAATVIERAQVPVVTVRCAA